MVFEHGPANSPQTNGIAERFNQTLLTNLNWKSPVSILLDLKCNIEPVCSLNSLIPFGLKAFVCRQPESKLLPPSKKLLYLGPEDYLDASQFLDPQTGLSCTTANNSSLVQASQVTIIPLWPCKNNITSTTPTIPDDRSPPTPVPSSEPTTISNPEPNQNPLEP
ncbi:hypothetical protein O181_017729 [Austropuccinia psidii MF-1]|uniref:Uncharacterized protein n=1 Tax=Austropuccinia psidii MF-1 TaxID=1389203 RepID=A0A9Q3GT24_9BASI|nr:hypothetical protein [Austropuccinia psidii MF-1]